MGAQRRQVSAITLPISSTETTLANAGGKGANLAALARAGWNVPPGYIVTTEAYRAFVERHSLQPRILDLVNSLVNTDMSSLEKVSADIRILFMQHAIPEALSEAILSPFRGLETARGDANIAVAVRSSATAEDLPGLAFAGQQETYLNVKGDHALLQAVVQCWSSLWTARAIAYRARNAVPPQDIALAVVVQQMIAAESAGVVFTANPLTGRRDEIVIDASFGLGEAIVSGQVEPDHYVVQLGDWRIKDCDLGTKALAVVPLPEGGTAQIARDAQEMTGQQALPDDKIVALAQTAARIAEQFGTPQDIEWALASGEIHILQARPITSLYPLPRNPFPNSGLRIYFSLNSIQGITEPLTPLGADTLRLLVGMGFFRLLHLPGRPSNFLPYVGDRIYIDVTLLARDPRLRSILTGLFERGDPGALASFRKLVSQRRIPLQPVLTRRRMLHLLPGLVPILSRILSTVALPERGRARARTSLEHATRFEREHLASASSLAERVATLQTSLPRLFGRILRDAIPVIAPSLLGLTIVDRWLIDWLGEKPGAALRIMRGVPGNVTTEMDLQLWQTAQAIRTDAEAVRTLRSVSIHLLADACRRGALPPVAQTEIAKFLAKYGMRASAEIDIGRPRWRDDPSPILATLVGYLGLEDPALAPDVIFEQGRQAAESFAAELVRRARRTSMGWLRARLLAAAVRRMRLLGGLRELPKFRMIEVLDLCRTALLDSAQDLVERGVIEQTDDIFFIPLDVLSRYAAGETLDLKETVTAERATYRREMTRRQMPRLLLSSGEAFYEGVVDTEMAGDVLPGDAVSPGVVEGIVQVVLDPRGARLNPGAILVCPATDPGWTPLFLTAGGLVMEIGGLVTHGSVVAREYGIPAVVGVHNATSRLHTGQRVRVDGSLGHVKILDYNSRQWAPEKGQES